MPVISLHYVCSSPPLSPTTKHNHNIGSRTVAATRLQHGWKNLNQLWRAKWVIFPKLHSNKQALNQKLASKVRFFYRTVISRLGTFFSSTAQRVQVLCNLDKSIKMTVYLKGIGYPESTIYLAPESVYQTPPSAHLYRISHSRMNKRP